MFTHRCAALTLSLFLGLSTTHAATIAGVTVPDSATVQHQALTLNGAGVRTKVFFDIYVAALYTKARTQDARAIIYDRQPRQMRLTLMRNLDAQTLIDALKEGVHANLTEPERQEIGPALEQFEQHMRSVGQAKTGDLVQLDMDAQGVQILFNQTVLGRVDHQDLAPALLKIWLGHKPVQSSLKQALLGLS
ncbi:MAG TPA: chalcone isomerase family protein [Alcaligenes sp.]|nr:chalcone isomerase family protein [Alcaligenes sp.]HRL27330.1 chalcone isomerase family protein [Alcaligenes sp.]